MVIIDEKWKCLCSGVVTIPSPSPSSTTATSIFKELIDVWISSYQVVNKRLVGVEQISVDSAEGQQVVAHVHPSPSPYRIVKIVPKAEQYSHHCYDVVLYEGDLETEIHPINLTSGTNHPHPHLEEPYALRLQCQCQPGHSSDVSLQLMVIADDDDRDTHPSKFTLLKGTIFPKMLKWLKRIVEKDTDLSACNALIDASSYHSRYTQIKDTWARDLMKNWTERTDPKKYIFEDVGICSYLLEYWKKHSQQGAAPTKVADLGCGNGLLVYFLQREGVEAVGIDVRKRKIWDQLKGVADLREVSIDPSSSSPSSALPEGITYLIGNHSDELTPWIPVMAARMGIGFFLLPCCPFNFYGKYNKKHGGGLSDQYYTYVQSIIERLGFELHIDRLKIPSRKRKCFIGAVPKGGLPPNVDAIIEEMLAKTKGDQFLPRPAVIEMRNCTTLPLEFRQALARKLFNYLLQLSDESISGWRCGGSSSLLSLTDQLSAEEKSMLRNQHGGLQTFLRNHHQIFHLQKGGVEIRKWLILYRVSKEKIRSPSKHQCFFFSHHPDGCPVTMEECPYLHV